MLDPIDRRRDLGVDAASRIPGWDVSVQVEASEGSEGCQARWEAEVGAAVAVGRTGVGGEG